MRLVVTGTGRCGTGYMARRLTMAGLGCGHEAVFNPAHVGNHIARRAAAQAVEAESSWMAVPFLGEIRDAGAKVLLLLRDPEAILRSLRGIQLFERPSVYRDFALQHTGLSGSDERTAWRYIRSWVEMAEPLADCIVSVEQLHAEGSVFDNVFHKLVDSAPKPHHPPPPLNHRPRFRGTIDDRAAREMRAWFARLER